jgi:hypothetical protein
MGAISPRLKHPNHEADQSPSFSAIVMDTWSYTSTAPYAIHVMVPHYAQE